MRERRASNVGNALWWKPYCLRGRRVSGGRCSLSSQLRRFKMARLLLRKSIQNLFFSFIGISTSSRLLTDRDWNLSVSLGLVVLTRLNNRSLNPKRLPYIFSQKKCGLFSSPHKFDVKKPERLFRDSDLRQCVRIVERNLFQPVVTS